MTSARLLSRVRCIRARIIQRYEQLEQGVQDGTIEAVRAFLAHLSIQDLLPELDAMEQEATST